MAKKPTDSQKARKAFEYFQQAEREGFIVSKGTIAENTGYTPGTAQIYMSKKWRWFLKPSSPAVKGQFQVKEFLGYPLDQFLKDVSQVRPGPGNGVQVRPGPEMEVRMESEPRMEARSEKLEMSPFLAVQQAIPWIVILGTIVVIGFLSNVVRKMFAVK